LVIFSQYLRLDGRLPFDSIKGDKFKHIDFSHGRVPFESYLSLW